MIDFKVIVNVLSRLIIINGVFMLLCLFPSMIHDSGDQMAFLYASGVSFLIGFLLFFITRKSIYSPGKREGYFIVTLGWIIISLFGALPFVFSGAISSFTDAFFETISGYTTTGASILTEIESLPEGILFWRSMTQWIGGMGIIVLTIAIMPFLGVGGSQMFAAEVPGPSPDKLHPRIKETAKRLWLIYLFLTGLETILLWIGGMSFYDAICHSFATMATGGYSTKNASIAFFDSPFIHYVIIAFMFFAGTNFSLFYFTFKGKVLKVIKNEEFKAYFYLVAVTAVIFVLVLVLSQGTAVEKAFRESLFQIVSILTTTGFATANYEEWMPFLKISIFMLMFIGGSAGSTGGGMKVMRILLLIKNSFREFKKLIHPRGVIPLRYNDKVVSSDAMSNILAFFFLYIIIFMFSALVMLALGLDFETALGSVAATLGNIGPGIGDVGPIGNYAEINQFGKWFLSFLMLLGRLELFTVLILFTKAFWKK